MHAPLSGVCHQWIQLLVAYLFCFVFSWQNIISANYGIREVLSKELVASNGCSGEGLGLVRGYLTSIGAVTGKQLVSNKYLPGFNSIFSNPRLRRLFCSEAPKKRSEKYWVLCFVIFCFGFFVSFDFSMYVWLVFLFCKCFVDYENYYPKNKKEIPKENNQKSESKGMHTTSGKFDTLISTIIAFWNGILMCWKYVLVYCKMLYHHDCHQLMWLVHILNFKLPHFFLCVPFCMRFAHHWRFAFLLFFIGWFGWTSPFFPN